MANESYSRNGRGYLLHVVICSNTGNRCIGTATRPFSSQRRTLPRLANVALHGYPLRPWEITESARQQHAVPSRPRKWRYGKLEAVGVAGHTPAREDAKPPLNWTMARQPRGAEDRPGWRWSYEVQMNLFPMITGDDKSEKCRVMCHRGFWFTVQIQNSPGLRKLWWECLPVWPSPVASPPPWSAGVALMWQ